MRRHTLRRILTIAGLLPLSSLAAAEIGFTLSLTIDDSTLVWPPSGLAIAAALLYGWRIWPGILVGQLLTVVAVNAYAGLAVAIVIGNTIEALSVAWLLRRLLGFRNALDRVSDVLALTLVVALASTVTYATLVAGLALWPIDNLSWDRLISSLPAWWARDGMMNLLFAAVGLTWLTRRPLQIDRRRLLEAACLLAGLLASATMVFGQWLPSPSPSLPITFALFPLLLLSAFRFGPRGAATAAAVVSSIAVSETARGFGPMATAGLSENLALVEMFMATVTLTTLLVAAAAAERERAEGAIRESEERYRRLVDVCPDAIFVLRHRRIAFANRAALQLLGAAHSGEVVTRSPLAFAHADDREAFGSRLRELDRSRDGVVGAEVRLVRADGSIADVETVACAFPDPGDAASLMVARDVTERQRAEQALRDSERRFRALIENSTDAVFLIDRQAVIGYASPATTRILGYAPGELLGRSAFELTHPADAPQRVSRFEELSARPGAHARGTIRFRHRDGGWRWIEGTATNLLEDPSVEAIVVNYRDVTERKASEDALRRSQARLQTALRGSHIGLWEWNTRTNEVYYSPEWKAQLGYADDEIANDFAEWDLRLHPDDRDDVRRTVADYLAHPWPDFEIEFRMCHRDGSYRWILARAEVDRDEQGRPRRMYGSHLDLTERRRAEEATRLLQTVTLEVSQAGDEHAALGVVLSRVCCATGWTVGQAWVPSADGTVLECSPAWHCDAEGFEALRAASVGLRLPPGVGLPGRTWRDRHAHWSRELREAVNRPRLSIAREAGVRVALGIPVLAGDEVVAVLELFTCGPRAEDDRLVTFLSGVAAQLGAVIRRKRAEDALRDSEERFRLLIEGVKDYAICLLDPHGQVISWNPAAERITGYRATEIVGEHVSRFYPPQDVEQDMPARDLQLAAATGRFEDEGWRVRKDGSRFWANVVMTALRDPEGHRRGFAQVTRDMTERMWAEEGLKASIREKEILLREVHHRVKNNLQVVCSLLNLQAATLKSHRTIDPLKESQNRVRAMALIHEMLYRGGDLSRVDVPVYIRTLVNQLYHSYAIDKDAVSVTTEIGRISLGLDAAIGCGLIINELVSNALKHAFGNRQRGRVSVELGQIDAHNYRLVVRDDGVGLPSEVDVDRTPTLGLQLVGTLTEQLGGQIEWRRQGGTEVAIAFPAPA